MNSVAEFLHHRTPTEIDLYLLPTRRFKTITFKLYVYRPLDEKITASSLLWNVLRRGSRGFPNQRKILAFLEDCYGATLTSSILKIGERQTLYLKLQAIADRYLPRGRNVDRVLNFLSDLVLRPVAERGGLRAEFVDQEKRNLRHAIEGLINDRMEYAHERCVQAMCAGEPYGRYELGRVEEIDPLEPTGLLAHHARTLRSAPVVLLVAGDFDPETLARKVDAAFALDDRRPEPPAPSAEPPSPRNGPREVIERRPVEQANLVIGFRTGTTLASEDYHALMVYSALLGGFPHSRLFVNVREKENLAYFAHSELDASQGLMFVTAGIDFAAYEKCVPVIRAQMEDLCAGHIGDDEWNKTIASIVDRVRKWNDDPSARMGAFAEAVLNHAARTPQQILERIRGMTREAVAAAGRKVVWDTIYLLTRP
jgi:predicted Zn-dependent peptidase